MMASKDIDPSNMSVGSAVKDAILITLMGVMEVLPVVGNKALPDKLGHHSPSIDKDIPVLDGLEVDNKNIVILLTHVAAGVGDAVAIEKISTFIANKVATDDKDKNRAIAENGDTSIKFNKVVDLVTDDRADHKSAGMAVSNTDIHSDHKHAPMDKSFNLTMFKPADGSENNALDAMAMTGN